MYRYYCLLIKTVVLVFSHNVFCVYGGSLRSINADKDNLQYNLDADQNLVSSLAYDICSNLKFYHEIHNKPIPFSEEDCQNNFMNPIKNKDKIPPQALERRKYKWKIVYDIAPIDDPDVWRLVVLTPVNSTAGKYLPYDLLEDNTKDMSTVDITPGEYQVWTTLISIDGNHSPWRERLGVYSDNQTEAEKNLDYSENQTKEILDDSENYPKMQNLRNHTEDMNNLLVSLNNTEVMKNLVQPGNHTDKMNTEDLELRNFCDGKRTEVRILPKESTSWAVGGLPLGKDCEVQLVGKCSIEQYTYQTPDCGDLPACIEYEKAHDLVLRTEPSAHGWDVFVSWSYLHQPLFFNVTFHSNNETRHKQLPGNVTEVVFEDVAGEVEEWYHVAVNAVLENRTVHTSSMAQFIEEVSWDKVSKALGGAWGALICAGVASGAVVLLWRRRRENQLKHIYFPELLDKPCKESGDALDAEAATSGDDWELKSEKLLLHEVIGEGAFGVVRRGTLEPAGKEVAVKMLKDFPTLDEIRSFRAEMELMKSVGAHPHVVSLVGCCSGRKPLIVAEYCSRGDLLSYLRCSWDVMVSKRNAKYYNNNIESTDYRNDLFKCQLQGEYSKLVVNKLYDLEGLCDTELTTRDLLSFCRQIAMGMEFLASNRLVHRDLAARNVLVSSDRTLKIADFGLSRDVYEENLYKQKGNGKLPMKWMALESLTKRIYTSQSDVWSFGVVMWEVVSVGASPYPGVPPERLPRLLRAGYRMPRPHNCAPHLYEVMLSCWRAHPRERPTFAQLHAHLDELLNSESKHDYLSLEADADDAPPPTLSTHKYVKMYLRDKLGWSREESYERPLRTTQSNHYSTPPASAYKLQPIT
ncbi:hypothetical protein ABMA28_006109 [Loxostege sticticalis]|uniref:receptor protein-tyrosine kinase n=1 Tax=Loxostege sticticalis TaxID=481309 RepID=A0ABD0SME4_LOXSC